MKRTVIFMFMSFLFLRAGMILAYDSVTSEYFTSNTTRPTVSLSEAMVNPPTGETEWIELYNSSSREMQLEDWFIDDIVDAGSSPMAFSGSIEPGGYLVIPIRSSVFNNGGDDVRLLDANKTEIDILQYSESKQNVTWARGPDETVFCLQNPTRGAENKMCRDIIPSATPTPSVSLPSSTPTPSPSPLSTLSPLPPNPTNTPTPAYFDTHDISISEVMVAPETGQKEWIELYNASDQPITLRDWYIDDEENAGSSPKSFSAELPAQGYYFHVFSSGMFNNGGDHVRIVLPTEQEIERFRYTFSEKGKTWGRMSGDENVFCLQEATPGFANTECIDTLEDESLTDQTDVSAGSSEKSEKDEHMRNTSETRLSVGRDKTDADEYLSDNTVHGSSTSRPSPAQLAVYQDTVEHVSTVQQEPHSFPQKGMMERKQQPRLQRGSGFSFHNILVRALAGISVVIASVVAFRLGSEFRSQVFPRHSFFPQKEERYL
jgi:hypothetical protein